MKIRVLLGSLFALSLMAVSVAFGAGDEPVLNATPVPEPGTIVALVAGLAGTTAFLRRK